ncbi:MAG: DUF58 domain-containing protein [Acidobacteria bacterium]|nr:DUF58 domain-containing protein [Acidobacteriota bacterium]
MQAPDPPLERQTLERLERLALRWRQSFAGLLGGNNVSRFSGVGHEFLDHRHFHHGDDLRSVNWRAFLRLERLFLKMFRTEPRTPVRILLDTSESMSCGAVDGLPGEAKFTFACRLAAALTYVGLVRLETMVLQPFAQGLGESFRAQGGRHRYAPAARFLSGLRSGGSSNFRETSRQFAHRYGSAGLAVIISDFLDDDSAGAALDVLAEQGHELYLVHLAGPADREPPWRGELEMVDAETGNLVRLQLDDAGAREYRANYDAYCAEIEHTAIRHGGRYVQLSTQAPLEDALYGALMASGAVSLQ